GSGSLLSQSSGTGVLFTLSLPASRRRMLAIRGAAGLAELFVLALVPALLISVVSPMVGERYGVGTAVVHGVCLFGAGSVFFSLAFMLSTSFNDLWRPLLIALAVVVVAGLAEAAGGFSTYGIFRVMSGETYFRTGALPWTGLIAAAALSAVM